jgi:hypothetical protein
MTAVPVTPTLGSPTATPERQLIAGENVDLSGITLAVTDAIIEAGEREEAAANGQQLL